MIQLNKLKQLVEHLELVDVHCHLDDPAFDCDRDQLIKEASEFGIRRIVSSSLSFEGVPRSLEINLRYPWVGLSLGWDYSVLDRAQIQEMMDLIRSLKNRILGIGEVGLDFWLIKDEHSRKVQLELFKEWIQLCLELDLPLIVHSRSAGRAALESLLRERPENVIMHAFDGSPSLALNAARAGIFFSIPPSIWHSTQKQKLASKIPLENLLLESDAPVLGPLRSQRNKPANLIYGLIKISQLRGISISKLAEISSQNAAQIFKF